MQFSLSVSDNKQQKESLGGRAEEQQRVKHLNPRLRPENAVIIEVNVYYTQRFGVFIEL